MQQYRVSSNSMSAFYSLHVNSESDIFKSNEVAESTKLLYTPLFLYELRITRHCQRIQKYEVTVIC